MQVVLAQQSSDALETLADQARPACSRRILMYDPQDKIFTVNDWCQCAEHCSRQVMLGLRSELKHSVRAADQAQPACSRHLVSARC
jgi:hypothetical protein